MEVRAARGRRRAARGAAAPATAAAILLVLASTVAACAGQVATTKAGGDDVRAVTIATMDPPGRPASDDVEAFAGFLEEASGGALDPEVQWESHRRIPDYDPADPFPRLADAVADQLAAGEVQLALLPDWIATDLGLPGIAAVKAPFVITDHRVVNELVVDPAAQKLLDGFAEHGLVGLALLPESMRHPLTYGPELTGPESYAGLRMRSLDPAAAPLFAELGAEALAFDGDTRIDLDGAESAYGQYASLAVGPVFVGDVTWYPKLSVLVADAEWFGSLSDEQRQWVTDAAGRTRDYVIDTTPGDAESAAAYCDLGGAIVLAGPEAVIELEEATEALRQAVQAQPGEEEMLDAIARIEDGLTPAPEPRACGSPSEAVDVGDIHDRPPDAATLAFPAGSYRATHTVEEFLARGVDQGTAQEHAHVWTIEFRDGVFVSPGCPGSTYRVSDDRISVRMGPVGPDCGELPGRVLFDARWTFDGTDLRLSEIRTDDGAMWEDFADVLWGGQPWRRIG